MDSPTHRVLMTTDTDGGVWTFAMELAQGLSRQGAKILLATLGGNPSPAQVAEAAAIPNLELAHSNFKLEWMEDPWDDVRRSGEWLLQLEAVFQPDIVHLNSLCHGALPWRTPVLLTAHSCVITWWRAVKGGELPPQWSRYRSEVERSLKAVDFMTVPSHAHLAAMRQSYPLALPDTHCRVIANSRNPARYRELPKQSFVLTAGRLWDEAKNIAAVIGAAPHLVWPVYLAGDQQGPGVKTGNLGCCKALGKLTASELASYYALAGIYVLPARYEPFGLSAVEAALSGCALVLGDIPSLREIWGDAAVFVPPDDIDGLAAVINLLADDPRLRRSYASKAQTRARSFSTKAMAAAYLECYELVGVLRERSGKFACAV